MTDSINVEVSQHDIDNGFPGRPRLCPIARAVGRKFPKSDYITVHSGYVHFRESSLSPWRTMILDSVGREFVRRFDAYWNVTPTIVNLIPEESVNG